MLLFFLLLLLLFFLFLLLLLPPSSQATEEIKNLYRQETWRFEEDEERGAMTQLPFLFENVVGETLQLLKDVVMSSKPGETEIFHQRIVQKDATELCTNLLRAFAACLDKAVFEDLL